jgi:hypothetical protein
MRWLIRFVGARESYTRFTRQGDQMRQDSAFSGQFAKAQLKTKLDEYALALAKPTANRLQAQSQNTVSSLQGATARVVPSGNVQPKVETEIPTGQPAPIRLSGISGLQQTAG